MLLHPLGLPPPRPRYWQVCFFPTKPLACWRTGLESLRPRVPAAREGGVEGQVHVCLFTRTACLAFLLSFSFNELPLPFLPAPTPCCCFCLLFLNPTGTEHWNSQTDRADLLGRHASEASTLRVPFQRPQGTFPVSAGLSRPTVTPRRSRNHEGADAPAPYTP